MFNFLDETLKQYSRRDFLKFSGSTLLSLWMLPLLDLGWRPGKLESADTLLHRYGRVINENVDVFDKPSRDAKMVTTLWQDTVKPINTVTISDDANAYNRVWYEIGNSGFVHSGKIQPVDINKNEVAVFLPKEGSLCKLTVPFSDAVWHPTSPHLVVYRLYFGTVYWANAIYQDNNGKYWYRIADDKWDIQYYVDATHFHIITADEISPLSSNVPPAEKRIEVLLSDQAVIAYEYNQPVFLARTATGARFIDGDYRTTPGNYITNRKRPSRHMAAGDPAAANSYDLPGIPWICYITEKGVSFHGTYWHNDFGKPRSHGCINLTPDDAQWLYRWSNPLVPLEKETENAKEGTWVRII